ncbi:MAG TPA: PLP-dependent aminotransferase family protein [Opitutaceae bacterium]|nr:PLP-dependent aminotransferase family protein [Opitutaceae bacterium]
MAPASVKSALPLYASLADSLQSLIEQGSLRPGQRVPSVRQMARQRGVSIATVIQAYEVLDNRSYIEARARSGYYVRARSLASVPLPRIARPVCTPAFVGIDGLTARVMEVATDPTYFPLGAACPDPALFPNKKLARVSASLGRMDPLVFGRYAINWAYEPLAQEISRRYLQTGTPLYHEDFIVTSGCTEALNLALRAVTHPGDTVVVETPVYFGLLQIIAALGLKALEVPVCSQDGIDLEALRKALDENEVKAVILTPTYQNPTGACMPDERKAELYELLCDYDVPAIEDDVYGDIHFGPHRPKPLKAWDREGLVLLCSSANKTLAPGLRVGWVAPGRYFERVRRLKMTNTLGTPVILQKILGQFLREGGYDRHLRKIRQAYHNQVLSVARAIQAYFPADTRFTQPQGGFVIWVEFPPGVDALRLHEEALDRKIGTAPGPLFSSRDRYRNCLRINCGITWSDRFDRTLRVIGELARRQL